MLNGFVSVGTHLRPGVNQRRSEGGADVKVAWGAWASNAGDIRSWGQGGGVGNEVRKANQGAKENGGWELVM